MLSPESLRRLAAEAAERLMKEKQAAEERRQREEEERRAEEERRQRLEAEQARLQQLARATVKRSLRSMIKTAAHGGRRADLMSEPEVAPVVVEQLEALGFQCRIRQRSKWHRQALERLSNLLLRLSPGYDAAPLRFRLTAALQNGAIKSDSFLTFLRALRVDANKKLGDEAAQYLNTFVLPHFESTEDDSSSVCVVASWAPVDVATMQMTETYQAPSWLLSTSGSGLIQRVGECMATNAGIGRFQTRFELRPVARNLDRWGHNDMTNFVHEGQPIGVTPFSSSVMAEVLAALGFQASVTEDSESVKLDVSWAAPEQRPNERSTATAT